MSSSLDVRRDQIKQATDLAADFAYVLKSDFRQRCRVSQQLRSLIVKTQVSNGRFVNEIC